MSNGLHHTMVKEIESTAQFDEIINGLPADRLLVVDFHATWCGPCKAIAPFVDRLADKYPDVEFVKIDVDQVKELAKRYKVSAMPTFKLFKGGKEVAQMRGAAPPQLAKLVGEHSGAPKDMADVDMQLAGGGAMTLQRLLLVAVIAYYVYQWWFK